MWLACAEGVLERRLSRIWRGIGAHRGIGGESRGMSMILAANAAVVEAARELLEQGTHEFWGRAAATAGAARAAFAAKGDC